MNTADMLAALDRDLHGVVVEVTEESELDVVQLGRAADELRRRGAIMAMDDTGAGYAGLSRLVQVRPEMIKLDRPLVAALRDRPEKRALVELGAAPRAVVPVS